MESRDHQKAGAAGRLLRRTRLDRGITQAQLALRAGTNQGAISRMESGQVVPTLETLGRLLWVMGAQLELRALPAEHGLSPNHLARARARSVEERLELAFEWNAFAAGIDGVLKP